MAAETEDVAVSEPQSEGATTQAGIEVCKPTIPLHAMHTRGPTRAEKAYEISKSFDFSDFYSDFQVISERKWGC